MTTALAHLQSFDKWVAWRYKQRGRGSKPTKPPVNPHNGNAASVSDPTTWGTYQQAITRQQADRLPGVGFVLTSDDGITGADLDHVRDPDTGVLKDWAQEVVDLAETYCEVSPSGTGLRFFWLGKLDTAIKNDKQSVEIYCDGRYLTITGNKLPGCPDEIRVAPGTLDVLRTRAAVVEETRTNGSSEPREETPWDKLNTAALHNLSAWVPDLFGSKAKPSARGGYRVPSSALGRNLEEDVSITPVGIVDFGVADQGDRKQGKRTPLTLVMEHKQTTFDEAVGWLCKQLGVQRPGVTVDPQDPMKTSRALVQGRFVTEDELRVLHRHRNTFWAWKGNCYRSIDDEVLRTAIWRFLENVFKLTDKGIKPFKPKKDNVSNILEALAAVCAIDPFIAMPTWLSSEDMPPADEFLACANGLLHIPTRRLFQSTPDFFGGSASTVEYNDEAAAPDHWLRFLDQVLGETDSIEALQEWMGYTLRPNTQQQKILLCVGPTRAGKGTYAKVHTALLGGSDSVVNPTMSQLSENFGLESLINKPLAIITDARISGRTDKATIVERLLSISGEDSLTVPRKFMPAWTGRLPTRFAVITNELPSLTEGSGALARRFVVLKFIQSFYGREDHGLERRLLGELSGILNWAIEGHDRLMARGYFIQPQNSKDQIETMELLGAPIKAFLRDRCNVGPACEVAIDELYERWKSWVLVNGGGQHAGTKEWFGRNLSSAVPGMVVVRRGTGGSEGRFYIGIGLADRSNGPDTDLPF